MDRTVGNNETVGNKLTDVEKLLKVAHFGNAETLRAVIRVTRHAIAAIRDMADQQILCGCFITAKSDPSDVAAWARHQASVVVNDFKRELDCYSNTKGFADAALAAFLTALNDEFFGHEADQRRRVLKDNS
jgi:hypothetical protein